MSSLVEASLLVDFQEQGTLEGEFFQKDSPFVGGEFFTRIPRESGGSSKADPEHLCCTPAGTCSEDSGFPDPETSDPAGDLSLVLNDLRTLPLDPIQRVCDGASADVEIAWKHVSIANGAVGDWTSHVQSEPELVVSEVGVAEIGRTSAGWSALDTAGVEPHNGEQELTPGSYWAFVDGLPVGVQNRGAVTNRTITSITSDSGRYDSLCGTGGGSG